MAFRFNFDVGPSEAEARGSPLECTVGVASSYPVVDRSTWLYVPQPAPLPAPPACVAIPGSRFVRAFADADVIMPGGLDIIRGDYEGGAKVWECTLDMEKWISSDGASLVRAATVVVDLGCGAGILGCAIQRTNPSTRVVYQDLNTEVIEQVTWPTVQLNGGPGALRQSVLVASSWARLGSEVLSEASGKTAWLRGSVDLVVSSETLYALDSYPSLLTLLDALLGPRGVAVFGSKSFYFGVGGGVTAFVGAAKAAGWTAEVVKSFDDGKTVSRALVCVKRGPRAADG